MMLRGSMAIEVPFVECLEWVVEAGGRACYACQAAFGAAFKMVVKFLQVVMFCGLVVFFYEFGAREDDGPMLPCLVIAWAITAVFWISFARLELWLIGWRARRKLPGTIDRPQPCRLPEVGAG